MQTFLYFWDRFEECVAVVMFSLLILFCSCQIISRFDIISFPLDWTEELSRYVFVTLSYVAASLAVARNRHVCVEVIDFFLPPRGLYILQKMVWLIWGVFSLWIAHGGWVVASEAFGTTTPVMEWDMGWFYLPIPLLFAVMAMRLFIKVLIEEPVTEKSIEE